MMSGVPPAKVSCRSALVLLGTIFLAGTSGSSLAAFAADASALTQATCTSEIKRGHKLDSTLKMQLPFS